MTHPRLIGACFVLFAWLVCCTVFGLACVLLIVCVAAKHSRFHRLLLTSRSKPFGISFWTIWMLLFWPSYSLSSSVSSLLSQDVIYDTMVALGFPSRVLSPWFRALAAMSHSILLDSCFRSKKPGVPEGDPLAVVAGGNVFGVFSVPQIHALASRRRSCLLRRYLVLILILSCLSCLPCGLFLKLWQVAHQSPKMLSLSNCKHGNLVRTFLTFLKRAAKIRNERVSNGHRRLLGLPGLPFHVTLSSGFCCQVSFPALCVLPKLPLSQN